MSLKAFPPLVFQMTVRGTQGMNYRIEKKDAIRVVGKKIPLRPTLEENFQITPRFWVDCAKDGTIARLAGMMDTPIYGLMGLSTCNEKDEYGAYGLVWTQLIADICTVLFSYAVYFVLTNRSK